MLKLSLTLLGIGLSLVFVYPYSTFAMHDSDISGGYVFDGKLKVSTTEGDTIKSKFYLLNADLKKAGSEETSSGLTEILEGDIGFGGTTYEPEFRYEVVNGTLRVDEQSPTLFLRGE